MAEIDAVFLAIFEDHRDRVFSTALRLTGRRTEAEDLTADTFLLAYRSLSGFDYERLDTLRPRAWLSAIVVNAWRNRCRTASRRPVLAALPAVERPDPADHHQSVEQQIENRDDGKRLAGILLELPDRQRIAVVLRYIGDLPVAEIADVMGCPTGSVTSLISRGLDRLRPLAAMEDAAGAEDATTTRGGPR